MRTEPERAAAEPPVRLTALWTALAMAAFAGNSVLNRLALGSEAIGAMPFAFIRVASGALVLALIIVLRTNRRRDTWAGLTGNGSWAGAACLYIYAAGFSLAYLSLDAGMGALILFASVQFTMIGAALRRGERMGPLEILGTALAFGALVYLLSPGLASPPLGSALLMIAAGIAWGGYSLLGAHAADPTAATAGNFLRAVPLGIPLLLALPSAMPVSLSGVGLAVLSGAVTSGLGYAIWYRVVPRLGSIRAAIVQLTVPVLAGLMGAGLLFEIPSFRLVIAGIFILGGVGLALYARTEHARG